MKSIEIRILLPGCPNCLKPEQMGLNACAEANMDADIQKLTDINEFAKQ